MDRLGSIYVGASSCFAGVIGKIELGHSHGLTSSTRRRHDAWGIDVAQQFIHCLQIFRNLASSRRIGKFSK
jgi:hypothetical protein